MGRSYSAAGSTRSKRLSVCGRARERAWRSSALGVIQAIILAKENRWGRLSACAGPSGPARRRAKLAVPTARKAPRGWWLVVKSRAVQRRVWRPAAGVDACPTVCSGFLLQTLEPGVEFGVPLGARVQERGAIFVALIEGPQIQVPEAVGHRRSHRLAQRIGVEQRGDGAEEPDHHDV